MRGAQPEQRSPPIGIATWAPIARPFLFNFPGLLRNVPTSSRPPAGRGLFTIRPERDGIVRRVPMVMQAQGAIMPSLTLEMLRVVSGIDSDPDPHRSKPACRASAFPAL